VIDVLRENRVRSKGHVGEYDNSVFDLQKQMLRLQPNVGDAQDIDLSLENSAGLIGSLLSGDIDYAELLYDLTGSEFDPLERFSGDRELVFSIGAEEAQATITPGGIVRFDNPEHLSLLDETDYITISLYQNNDSANILWEFAFEKIRLIADMNNDGKIIKQSTVKNDTDFIDTVNSTKTPFLFWVNDDDDVGEISAGKDSTGDVPGKGTADYSDNLIDGMRDLVDFFPVYIDAKSALETFPITEYSYRLVHADNALKFTETDLYPMSINAWETVDAPLKHTGVAAGLANKEVQEITSNGVNLSPEFLNKILQNQGGIILVEATQNTGAPLKLEVVKNSNNSIAAHAELVLKIDIVENMYRNIDLKPLATQRGAASQQGLIENTNDPLNNPDDRTDANYLVFVHGYDVSSEAARGWNAEMFKRYHRLGFNGRFIGVNWHGDTGLDYHHAVYNAFQTSMGLNAAISRAMPEPGPLTVAGHSLGNIVVSNAIAHGGLSPTRYFMINAAAPIEAYASDQAVGRNGVTMKDNMTEIDWQNYPEKLYSANWYQLFGQGDDRRTLTWKDYFGGAVSVAYNFYSPGEDVLENANTSESFSSALWTNIWDLDFSQHAWVMSEIGKGCKNLIAWTVFKCSGGWNFNNVEDDWAFIGEEDPSYDDTDPSSSQYKLYSAADAVTAWNGGNNGALTQDELAQYGYFKKLSHFENDENGYSYLYQPIASTVALQNNQHAWDLLASGIPAMSFAAAANPVNRLNDFGDRNFNMEDLRGNNQLWPSERTASTDLNTRWLHSDIRNVALPYVYHSLDLMLEIGEFK